MNNQNGSTLVVVLIVLFVLSILSIPFMTMSLQGQKTAIYEENNAKAYYIALAGAEMVSKRITDDVSKAAALVSAGKSSKTPFGDGEFEVQVTNGAGGLKVQSLGVKGKYSKSVTINLSKAPVSGVFENSVFSKNDLVLGAMKRVTGPLESNGSIDLAGLKSRGDNPQDPVPYSEKVYPPPVFPTGLFVKEDIKGKSSDAERTINSSGHYNKIELGNEALYFDTSGGVLQVVVDTFITKGDIVITGGNRLELYIITKFDTQTKSDINPTNPGDLFIYLQKDCDFKLKTGNSEFYGYIYGPEANVTQIAGAGVNGAMIVGSFTGESSATIDFVPYSGDYDITPTVAVYRVDSYN